MQKLVPEVSVYLLLKIIWLWIVNNWNIITNLHDFSSGQDEGFTDPERSRRRMPSKEHIQLAKAMTISIAYAANVGGTTTITGCASNIILKGLADE